jgi:hypothetical protein
LIRQDFFSRKEVKSNSWNSKFSTFLKEIKSLPQPLPRRGEKRQGNQAWAFPLWGNKKGADFITVP